MPSAHPVRRALIIIGCISLVLIVGIIGFIYWATQQMQSSSYVGYAEPEFAEVVSPSSGTMAKRQAADMMAPSPIIPPSGAGQKERERIGPKIIKNGSLTVRVDNAERKLDELSLLTKTLGGFVAESRMTDDAGERTVYATLRIPSNKFDEAMSSIKKLALVVFDQSSNSEDVTAQFVDLDARLRAAKAEEAQYLEILKRAGTIKDTLEVTERLADVRTRIEQLQGEMRYLTDQTDYSTLRVTMTEETTIEIPTRTWKPWETIKGSFQTLIAALQVLIDVLIVSAIFLIGLLLPIVIVLWLFVRLLRWMWKKAMGKK